MYTNLNLDLPTDNYLSHFFFYSTVQDILLYSLLFVFFIVEYYRYNHSRLYSYHE